jgi:hypothetical protein
MGRYGRQTLSVIKLEDELKFTVAETTIHYVAGVPGIGHALVHYLF